MYGAHEALVQHLVALWQVVGFSRSLIFNDDKSALFFIGKLFWIKVSGSVLCLLLLTNIVKMIGRNLIHVLFNRVALPAMLKIIEIEAANHLSPLIVTSDLIDVAIFDGHQPWMQACKVVHRRQFEPSLLLLIVICELQAEAGWLARHVRRHAHVDLERRKAAAHDKHTTDPHTAVLGSFLGQAG